jgi:uncharacterized membrane protein YbaN (DUF454 family)
MGSHLKRTLIFIAGILCLILGVIGLVLPFLQGLLFIAIGLILLSIASPRARALIERYTRKFPQLHAFFERMEKRISDFIG